jgi:hypothetical protein
LKKLGDIPPAMKNSHNFKRGFGSVDDQVRIRPDSEEEDGMLSEIKPFMSQAGSLHQQFEGFVELGFNAISGFHTGLFG